LVRTEIDAFATDGLTPVRVESLSDHPPYHAAWRAEFRRAVSGG
jgi:hypothetical protein